MTWQALAEGDPELAAFGRERVNGRVCYLATVRRDGAPRVHPVTPIIGEGRLFVFMEPTSPKGHDLRRGSPYALHCAVDDNSGASGEFGVDGVARLVSDPAERALATRFCRYDPADRYLLFELTVARAKSTVYEGDETVRRTWSNDA